MGLRRIVLRDFVIVSELDLDLQSGFTVLTGETGAGKSILIDALQFATGGRADTDTIREGAQRAEVCAEFDVPPALCGWLEAAGLSGGDVLLLRRALDTQGKSRGWINGSPATATQLRELALQLLDIHGQHAWQSLTRASAVRGLLDAYAGLDAAALVALWQQWRAAADNLATARLAQENLQTELERLVWQIDELTRLAPRSDEWAELQAEQARLSHIQTLLQTAQDALNCLDDAEVNTRGTLCSATEMLQKSEHLEPDFRALADVLTSSLAQVDDTVRALRAYLRHTEADPQRLTQIDERLAQWLALARRYRRAPEDLPGLLATWQQDLARLDAATDLGALESAARDAELAYMGLAREHSTRRKTAALRLAQSITQAMQGLGMQGGRFEVALQPCAHPGAGGLEDVDFLVAAHTGSSPRPISKVASGGELSRLALAVAVTTSELGSAPTLIFDEIDSGVGGSVAETVGRLMHRLGGDRQVLAVTHLPQVAACAHHHVVVAKQLQGEQTLSSVQSVAGEQRVAELARMLGGEHLSPTTLAHAREMLQTLH